MSGSSAYSWVCFPSVGLPCPTLMLRFLFYLMTCYFAVLLFSSRNLLLSYERWRDLIREGREAGRNWEGKVQSGNTV